MINGGPVLYLIYLIFAKKKFIVQKKYLHLVVLGQETVDCVMRWRRRVFELLSNFLLLFILFGLERIIKAFQVKVIKTELFFQVK